MTPEAALRSEAAYILTREGLDATEAARALDATAARYIGAAAGGGDAGAGNGTGADGSDGGSAATADDATSKALECGRLLFLHHHKQSSHTNTQSRARLATTVQSLVPHVRTIQKPML